MSNSAVQLPSYFNCDAGEHWYSVGDRVYGTISVSGCNVKYRFNDGSRPYEDTKEFDSESKAQKFASKFAVEMRRCEKRNTVPMLDAFRRFN